MGRAAIRWVEVWPEKRPSEIKFSQMFFAQQQQTKAHSASIMASLLKCSNFNAGG